MKKGFTLIELLGVLLILSVLIVISVPVVGKTIANAKKKNYEIQVSNVESAAKSWAIDNILFKINDGDTVTITLSQLKASGSIGKKIKNPLTDTYFPNDMEILLTRTKMNINAELIKESGSDTSEFDSSILVFILFGRTVENIEINTPYTDAGIEFTNSIGEVVGYSAIIKKDGVVVPTIDTSVIGKYEITYVTNDINKIKVVRTLNVSDTIPPVIEISGPLEVNLSNIASLDLNSGVTVSDNSLLPATYTISGNVEPVIGTYAVTYTSKDSSNNIAIKSRIIKVIAD